MIDKLCSDYQLVEDVVERGVNSLFLRHNNPKPECSLSIRVYFDK